MADPTEDRVLQQQSRLDVIESPPTAGEGDSRAAELAAEISAASGHLAPLDLGDDATPLSELCRRAVLAAIRRTRHGKA